MFVVAEGLHPKLFAGHFVGVHADRREFVLEERRVVGEFGLPQSVQPEVLLTVDQRETFGEVLCEEFVDDRESAVELRVGLLYMGVEGVVVDRRAVGEGREA